MKYRMLRGIVLVASFTLFASYEPQISTAATVTISPSTQYQTMDGIGACSCAFPYGNDGGWNWNSVKFVFDELDLHYIRLVPWMYWWEKYNDNADPNVIYWPGFGVPNNFAAWYEVPFAKYLTSKGIQVHSGVWGLAEWIEYGNPVIIHPADYPELGELLASYALNMQNNGVPQPYGEIKNEPAISTLPTAAALRDAALAVLTKYNHFGLTNTNFCGPEYHTPTGAASWAQTWLANSTLRNRTAAVSYHTWWSANFADYNSIRQVAQQYNKPVWATEVGYCALYDGCWFDGTEHYLRPETWGTAWDYAMSHYRALAWSGATRSYQWTILGWDAAVSTTGQRYPSFYILKHFANFIPPGAVRVSSSADDSNILVLAFLLPEGDYSLVIINRNTNPTECRIALNTGEPFSISGGFTTTQGSYEVWFDAVSPDYTGYVTLTLPAQSVTSAFAIADLPADLDGDCDVDWFDFAVLAKSWRLTGPTLPGDIDGNGVVDNKDLAQFAHWWLYKCTQP